MKLSPAHPAASSAAPHNMAIMHVVDSLERGGLERLVHDLAIAQRTAGHHVLVFSINHTGGYIKELRDSGITVIEGGKSRSFDTGVLRLLRQSVLSHKIDVVHAHNFVPNYHVAAALLGMRKKPRHVLTCHDMGARLSNSRLKWLFKLSILCTNDVAMVGQQVHAHFIRSGFVPATKAMALLNAVPLERFEIGPAAKRRARQFLALPADALVVGCVGRLVELKNHQALLHAWPAVLQTHPGAKLVLIGDGPLRTHLTQLANTLGIANAVVFAGLQEDVANLLPALDIFALPSTTEGVSIALLEACACGLPAIASRVGGNVEVVQDKQTGLLFEVSDSDALLSALLSLMGDTDMRNAMGRNARNWVKQHASLDALVAAYTTLYTRSLA